MFRDFKSIFILSIPLMLKYVFLLLFIDLDLFNREDIIEDIVFLVIIILLLRNLFIKKQYFVDVICCTYILYLILESTSYMAVSSNFSSSYMYLLIESNKQELIEFSLAYISTPIVIFIIIISILFFVVRRVQIKKMEKGLSYIEVLGILSIILVLKFTGYIESNAYHNVVRGVYGYIELQNNNKLKIKLAQKDIIVSAENELMVVVLGESSNRNHMQLYGYERETTPKLNAIREDLFVYNDVISTEVFTLKAMPKIITSMAYNSKNDNLVNLVQLFNTAGYDTYWLSNQRPISYHDNIISRIASKAKEFKFYSHLIDKHTIVLDEAIFPDYERIIKSPGKKVVFIRLIGAHFDYSNRYPNDYNKFARETHGLQKGEILNNQYDNAILYNDFIIYSLIKKLEEISAKSALIYISDHGENIYDEGTNFFGRSEEVITQSMFEIPFIFWNSIDFEFPKDFIYEPNRKFIADHTYESIGHIFGVMHKDMKLEHSIFSKSFKERKRVVLDRIDFDNYFFDTQ